MATRRLITDENLKRFGINVKNSINSITTKADAAAEKANTAADKANAAADAAGKVNAVMGDDHVLTITDRTGAVKSADLGDVSDVARIKKSLGPYSERPDIVLTAKETNVAVSADGVKVSKTGWAIAEFTAEKGNVYLFKPNVVDGSVCIFSEYIQSVETRGIDYTYTYNTDGTVASASATYLGTTHTYTYTYAEDKSCTITDETGAVVKTLPMVYETKVGTYSPLVSLNADAELPKDGYCRYMSHFKGNSAIKLAVSYKVGVADLTMKVTRDGVLASISTQLGNLSQKEDETRKKIDELHGNWVDVLYLTDTTAYVDNKEILIKGKTRTRLYPKKQFHFGVNIESESTPLLWADLSHLTSAIQLSVFLYDIHIGLFAFCNKIKSVELNNLDISKNTSLSYMFYNCSSLQSIGIDGWDVSKVTDMNSMFSGCSSLESIMVDGWDVSNVTSMYYMFSECSSLKVLDLSGWDVSNVTSMEGMFMGCSSLQSIGVDGWNVSNVTNMNSMFSGCSSLESIMVDGWDVSNVTSMYYMFSECSSLKVLDLSGWDVSNVTSMEGMFMGCSSLQSIGVDGWNVSKVTDMNSMFDGCSSLKVLDLSGWELVNCVNINLGQSNFSPVTLKLGTGFFKCPATVAKLNFSNWVDSSVRKSLVTNSYDRRANGLPDLTLTLHNNTKAVLSEDDKATMTAKGYIIA